MYVCVAILMLLMSVALGVSQRTTKSYFYHSYLRASTPSIYRPGCLRPLAGGGVSGGHFFQTLDST